MAYGKKNPREAEAFLRNPWVKGQVQRQVEKTLAEIRRKADWEVWVRENNPEDVVFQGTRLLWIVDRAAHLTGIDSDTPELRIIAGAASAIAEINERPKLLDRHRVSVQAGFQAAERIWPQLDIWALANAEVAFHKQAQSPDGILLSQFSYFVGKAMQQLEVEQGKPDEKSMPNG